MKRVSLLILVTFLLACNSQKTISNTTIQSDTHKVSYGPGGKIVRGNPEKKEIEFSTANKTAVVGSYSEASKIITKQKPIVKHQTKKEKKETFSFLKNKKFRTPRLHTSKASIIAPVRSSDNVTNAALIFGIISVTIGPFIPFVGIAIALTGLILSIIALKNGNNKKKAKTALILSIIGLVLAIALTSLLIAYTWA
jgi:hypothetical protein